MFRPDGKPIRKILFVAGEASGDTHASLLAKELKQNDPSLKIYACGGKALASQGAEMLANLADIAVVGGAEVLLKYRQIRKIFYAMVDFLEKEKPDAVILVDYPGFNLKLAAEAKKRGIGVVYYVSPQIWAWAPERIHKIKRDVDLMLVILPFEQALYENAGVPVRFVGHPSLDRTIAVLSREEWLKARGWGVQETYIALLPGSRAMEVQKLLPAMLDAAEIIAQKYPMATFLIPCAGEHLRPIIAAETEGRGLTLRVLNGQALEAARASKLALVASGTATLETAMMGTPMLISYKCNPITYWIARMLVKIPYLGLVNVLAGKCVAPEFLQGRARGDLMAAEALAILDNPERSAGIQKELDAIRRSLGQPGASGRAAQAVSAWLEAKAKA